MLEKSRRLQTNYRTLCQVLQQPNGRASPSATTPRITTGNAITGENFPEIGLLSPEPKFVRKRRQSSDNMPTYDAVSTFENEVPEKS